MFIPTIYRTKWSLYFGNDVNFKLSLVHNNTTDENSAFFRIKMNALNKFTQLKDVLFYGKRGKQQERLPALELDFKITFNQATRMFLLEGYQN